MLKILRNVFRYYEGEGTRVGVFFTLAGLLSAGIAITSSLGDALFLTRVGTDSLPQLYIMMPVVMLIFIPVYSHLITRYGIDRVFNLTMCAHVGLAVIICAGLIMYDSSAAGTNLWFYYLVKLNAYVWMVSLYSLFWNFVDTYFDILDAKRLFPFFSGGLAFGASVGGGLISLLGETISIGWLFLLWGLLSLLVLPVLALIRRSWKKIAVEDSETARAFSGNRFVLRTLSRSTYVSMIFVVLFMILFLTTMAEYSYLEVFSRSNTEAELAMLFGKLFFLVNIFNLLVNFFLFNRMVSLIGVRNVALIQPLAYLLAFSIFMINDGLSAAYIAFFAYQGIMISIDANNWNFLFNAVPQQLKAQIRTFAEGLVDPLGTSIAGVFLLFVAPLVPLTRLAAFSFGFAVLLLLGVLFLRSRYKDAMVNVLKSNWLDFSRTHADVAAHITSDEIAYIRERMNSGDIPIVAECLRLVYVNERSQALEILLDLLEKHRDSEMESRLKAFLFFFLKDEDIDVRSVMFLMARKNRLRLQRCT
jgi:ATP/ADP translocase